MVRRLSVRVIRRNRCRTRTQHGGLGGLSIPGSRGEKIEANREKEQKNREEERKNREAAKEATRQRQEELRWRKAGLARDLLERLHDARIKDALHMLDWVASKRYEFDHGGRTVTLEPDREQSFTKLQGMGGDDLDHFIRDRFDAFPEYLGEINHAVDMDVFWI